MDEHHIAKRWWGYKVILLKGKANIISHTNPFYELKTVYAVMQPISNNYVKIKEKAVRGFTRTHGVF